MERVQIILNELGKAEDQIFKKRQQDELSFRYLHVTTILFAHDLIWHLPNRARMRRNKKRNAEGQGRPAYLPGGQFAPRAVGRGFSNPTIVNAHQEILLGRQQAFVKQSDGNAEAAVALRAMLRSSVMETFFHRYDPTLFLNFISSHNTD